MEKNFRMAIKVTDSAEETVKKISQVNGWWARDFSGSAEQLNDKFTVRFGQTFVSFQIIELLQNKKVVWKVTDCYLHWLDNKKEWNDTEVVFEIRASKNLTELTLTHIGLAPDMECYDDCEEGWNFHFGQSLANFINTGKGQPQ